LDWVDSGGTDGRAGDRFNNGPDRHGLGWTGVKPDFEPRFTDRPGWSIQLNQVDNWVRLTFSAEPVSEYYIDLG